MLDDVKPNVPPCYATLDVVIDHGEGPLLFDVNGKKYIDMFAGYGASNFGHSCTPITLAVSETLSSISACGRTVKTDKLERFLNKLTDFTGKSTHIVMNSGAEGVEAAIKVARRWGYREKKIEQTRATIIVADNSFHGRTTGIISSSSYPEFYEDFGPLMGGFVRAEYGNSEDFRRVARDVKDRLCAIIVEPIQGEAGVIVPAVRFLRDLRNVCNEYGALLIVDEIQSGFGRSGKKFGHFHSFWPDTAELQLGEPDGIIMGKSLGGGVYPVSTFSADWEIMKHMGTGSHGSTFGGNPIAAAAGIAAIDEFADPMYLRNAQLLGVEMHKQLHNFANEYPDIILDVSGIGPWGGIHINTNEISALRICRMLAARGVLTSTTHGSCIRMAPPLVMSLSTLCEAMDVFGQVLGHLR